MKLAKKTALITGGSIGIGKAIVKRFQDEGAKVIVFDLEKPDYDVNYFAVDISNEDQIKEAVRYLKNVDILVNNAGIYFQESIETTTK